MPEIKKKIASVMLILISENKNGKEPNKAIDIHALLVNKKACLNYKCSVALPLADRKKAPPTNRVVREEAIKAGQSLLPYNQSTNAGISINNDNMHKSIPIK